MKKIVIRALALTSVLAFAATVAAAEAPRPAAQDEGKPTLSCTQSGMSCGSSSQCCSKNCVKQNGRIVGKCD